MHQLKRYNIVLLVIIWKLWSKDEKKALNLKKKKMATACCQGRAQGYRIRRALASARALCPFPEYCPVFHKG
jgi:hypothetical protein